MAEHPPLSKHAHTHMRTHTHTHTHIMGLSEVVMDLEDTVTESELPWKIFPRVKSLLLHTHGQESGKKRGWQALCVCVCVCVCVVGCV